MTSDDMRPDAGVDAFIAASNETFTDQFDDLPIAGQRALYDRFWQRFHAPHPAGVTMEEVTLPGPGGQLRGLLYRPPGGRGDLPVVLYFHGGSWTLGSPESHDIATSRLCAEAEVAVLSLDYRLAPEHPYPAALMDCRATLDWVVQEGPKLGLDPSRLAVAGDSAGGNLAAALCLWVRDHGGPAISFQALIYPALTGSPDTLKRYFAVYGGGRVLDKDPYAMPLSAKSLKNLPPAYVATAGLDPIQSHGERYVDRLRHDDITCDYSCGFGLPHTYLRVLHTSWRAAEEFSKLAQAMKAALRPVKTPAA